MGSTGTTVEKRLGPVPCFHATDCENQDGDFCKFTKPQSAKLAADLAELIADRKLIAIGGSVYRDDWNYAASARMKKSFPDPYYFCFGMAISQAAHVSAESAGGEPVSYVLAHHQEYGVNAAELFKACGEMMATECIGSDSVAKPKCLIQLQAADLFAYENYRELIYQLDNPGMTAPARENMKTIARAIRMESKFANVDNLHVIANEIDELAKKSA